MVEIAQNAGFVEHEKGGVGRGAFRFTGFVRGPHLLTIYENATWEHHELPRFPRSTLIFRGASPEAFRDYVSGLQDDKLTTTDSDLARAFKAAGIRRSKTSSR